MNTINHPQEFGRTPETNQTPETKPSQKPSATPLVSIRNVEKFYGPNHVLRGIDLDIRQGDVVAMIGASGSGKSTLLKCLNLLERIDDGQIFFAGQDISHPHVNADHVRARIGVVFQQFNLFPHLNVLNNVTLALRHVHRVPTAQAHERGMELLDRIGLRDKAQAFPDRLSGGQQQRVAIVRAIASNPELLLLDEITSALDPELVAEVLELVRELKGSTTIVMATHEMAFARDVADHVVFLDQGVLAEEGNPEQIFTQPSQPRTQEFLSRFLGR